MSYISRKEAQASYRPNAGLMSPGLKRAREPYRFRNALTGLLLGSFAVGIWAWSISAVKQDAFDDVDEEARELIKARENANASAGPGSSTSTSNSSSSPTNTVGTGTTGVVTIGSPSSNAKGRVDEAASLALSSPVSERAQPNSTPPSTPSRSGGWLSWFSGRDR
ncbi:hypothetical protein BDN72DRAFT_876767 [Pluteus cervinus]|uniref:Uncharacterized protein n=1 Tax=Pluteus cervinus TaxID=181527 RepID=A0ACD3B333_9AGAR|nr:hypothetical protein BDN72DRAFT_876767 [Pluteus cervinus]